MVSPAVDAALSSLLNMLLQCEVEPWYNTLVLDTKPAVHEIR